ncbi:flagellar biosynthesis protein FlhF [Seleniivibrio woodruffii]|uniref:Flagellar biosynthesis protein FlhF n=1 Tax=Seleniivibrio woodruffii TaxID=1078050 RepID=A0A4R1KB61_9BACT|nr:flagellar biosynthesis protein FlhF [Seleniivibrio woodruffii]TCK61726.1 flagellar biosynthesis protein FlhF [Seleniivibrio woodruffii]TVZ35159.1 flagellar biosynthesis protein FlhF [Seleniivibrio woodruffii]
MRIKKYEVFDMKEAMKLIKEELGPEAMILSTRKVVKNNSFGLFSRPIIEVTVGIEDDERVISARKTVGKTVVQDDPFAKTYKPQFRPATAPSASPAAPERSETDRISEVINALGLNRFEGLINDISEIKRQMMEIKSGMKENFVVDLAQPVLEFYNILLKNGVDDDIAYKFLKKIEKRAAAGLTRNQVKNLSVQLLGDLVPLEKDYFSSLKQKVLALVGPTGVGKTTTIAKIAANLSLQLKKSVALITIDNFRIGAVEQLKNYAEIVSIPLRVASSPNELEKIIYECKDFEYVFIDSMGRSQFDNEQIGDLRKFLEVSPLIKVALVLSMSCNHQELSDTFDRYSKLMPEYTIFTKLDETKYFGPLINLPIKKKTPIMLLSKGQNVPDDMEIPDGRKIASQVLREIPSLWSDK